MKTTKKHIEKKDAHNLMVTQKNVYEKSLGKASLKKETYKPLHRNMYK